MSETPFKVTFARWDEGPPLWEDRNPRNPTIALLRNMAKLHRTHIHCHIDNAWDRQTPARDEEGHMHLYYGHRPPGDDGQRMPLTKVFGHPLERSDRAPYTGPVLGRGWIVHDGVGRVPIAQIIGRSAYVLVPVHELPQGVQHEVMARILQGIMKNIGKMYWNETADLLNLPPDADHVLKGLSSDWHSRRYMGALIRIVDGRIEKLEKELAGLYSERQRLLELQERLGNVDGSGHTHDLYEEFTKLRDIPKVSKVFARQEGLHLETAPLIATHQGKRYAMGRFEMRFTRDYAVHVWSLEPTHPKGIAHPHIGSYTGFTCYGSATRGLRQMLGERRLVEATRLVLEWLERGYTEGQAEHPIEQWPEAPVVEETA